MTEDEELEPAPQGDPVPRWSWLLFTASALNFTRNVLLDASSHLEDVVYMTAAEARHRAHKAQFAADVRADLESIPTTKE